MDPSAHPAPINFDRVAAEYDATRGGIERARISAADVAGQLPPGHVLEVGVGTGIVAQALLATAPQVSRLAGVDISARMLEHAQRRLPGRVLRASADRLPFPAGTFDAVVAVHVLQLVPDLARALREAARVLRPGGRVIALHGEPEPQEEDELDLALRGLKALQARRDDSAATVRAAAEGVGLRCLAQHPSTPRVRRHTPADFAELISRRTWSSLWNVEEAAWRSRVVPSLEALRALPDQERPRAQHVSTTLTVLARE